jgi:hypothetical protein
MKTLFATLSVILLFSVQSCKSESTENKKVDSEKEKVTLTGVWMLYKEQKNGKVADFSDKPSVVSIEFKENGYFLFFDKITDKKIKDSGVDEIQVRFKGQYEFNAKSLKMNHFENDSLIAEEFTIENLTENELQLRNKATNHIEYYKK